jgi:hypothetical protein
MPDEVAVLVAEHFLPLNAVSAQRALRMARALLERFARLYLVCRDPRDLDEAFVDREYGRDVLADPRLVRLDARPVLSGYGYGVKLSTLHRVAGALATRALCGPGVDWIPAVRRALARVPAGEVVHVAIATGPPFATFGTVVEWARRRGAASILDYRDLWTGNPHARYPRIARRLVGALIESRVNRRATLLTTVSDGCRQMLEANGPTAPVRLVYNAPDRAYVDEYRRLLDVEHGAEGRPPRPLRIVYTGLLYPGCTCAPLLDALSRLPPERQRQIEVHYYGGSSGLARQEFERVGLTDRLVDHGKVSKQDALRAVIGADLLLSLIHTDREAASPAITGLMTTKVYDYLLSGNPIVNIGPVNAEAVHFAARMGYRAFHTFTAGDVDGLRGFLDRALDEGGVLKTTPLSVPLPDFEAELNAAVDEAIARAPERSP